MTTDIPAEAHAAVIAELEADAPEYRNGLPNQGEWRKPNRGSSPLLALRLPADTLEELQKQAAENGVAVSALARSFITEGLARQRGDDLPAALERLERDVAAVKAQALAG
ncbi:MAG: hypothetical protein ACTII7_11875 [Galactobacter sp.]